MSRSRVCQIYGCQGSGCKDGLNLCLAGHTSLGEQQQIDPFNGKDFGDLSEYLGFRHERKMTLKPQTNAEAKQFIRILKKLYKESKLTVSNFKQEVYRFLRAYRGTPHCTTKIASADLMYPSHKFPSGVTPCGHDFEELYQRDFKKMLMNGYRRQQEVCPNL